MKQIMLFILTTIIVFSCTEDKQVLMQKDGLVYLADSLYTGIWIETSESDDTLSEINYSNGRKEGKYTFYDSLGNLWYEGYIKNGFEDSLWTEWHTNGTIKEQGMFREGIKKACWKVWDAEGELIDDKYYRIYQKKFESGQLHYIINSYTYNNPENWWNIANCEFYFENGNKKTARYKKYIDYKNVITQVAGNTWNEQGQIVESFGSLTYADTLKHWIGTTNKKYSYGKGWNDDGTLTRNDTTYQLKGITYRDYMHYYDNGAIKCQGSSVDSCIRQGEWFWGDSNGDTIAFMIYKNDTMIDPQTNQPFSGVLKLESPEDDGALVEATYKHGIKNGAAKHFWNPEGDTEYHLSSVGDYKNKKKDGLWTLYNQKGIKTETWTYKEGILHGKTTVFYANGDIKSSTYYTKGEIDGESISYYKNQKIKHTAHYNYSNNYKLDTAQYFYPNGKLQGLVVYKSESLSLQKWYHKSGIVGLEGEKIDGIKNGVWRSIHSNGKLGSEKNHLHGNLNGEAKVYHYNGNIKLIFNAWNNILTGPFKLYNKKGELELEGEWLNGIRHGKWKRFDKNGKQIKEVEYQLGESQSNDTIHIKINFEELFDH